MKAEVVEVEEKKLKKLIKLPTVENFGKAGTSKARSSPVVNSKSATNALPKQVKAKNKSKEEAKSTQIKQQERHNL
jgi:hypothetical protein